MIKAVVELLGGLFMLTHEMTSEIVSGLIDIFESNILEIILYGSVAREEETSESDIDIAIILKKGFNRETKEKFISWAASMDLKYGRVFSIIDIEQELYDKWNSILPFYKNVNKEGIVLWKAA